MNVPNGVRLFSEQQLRRYKFEDYPDFAHRSKLHRPDGYTYIPTPKGGKRIAIEVELHPKKLSTYEFTGHSYQDTMLGQTLADQVLWLVPRESSAHSIRKALHAKDYSGKKTIHSFATFPDFVKLGWQAPIVSGDDGSPICHEVFSRIYFQRDCRLGGIRRIRFHDLRHTATTLMIAEGTDVNTVREICGHKSLKTTMDYVHLLGGAVKRVAKLFGIIPHPTGSVGSTFERPRLKVLK